MKIKNLISILIAFLLISLCDSNLLTFYDDHLAPQQILSYPDNSIVVHLAERLDAICNVQRLTYRIIYPNGTSNLVTVHDHQIPSFNFCTNEVQGQDQIIRDRLILI